MLSPKKVIIHLIALVYLAFVGMTSLRHAHASTLIHKSVTSDGGTIAYSDIPIHESQVLSVSRNNINNVSTKLTDMERNTLEFSRMLQLQQKEQLHIEKVTKINKSAVENVAKINKSAAENVASINKNNASKIQLDVTYK